MKTFEASPCMRKKSNVAEHFYGTGYNLMTDANSNVYRLFGVFTRDAMYKQISCIWYSLTRLKTQQPFPVFLEPTGMSWYRPSIHVLVSVSVLRRVGTEEYQAMLVCKQMQTEWSSETLMVRFVEQDGANTLILATRDADTQL